MNNCLCPEGHELARNVNKIYGKYIAAQNQTNKDDLKAELDKAWQVYDKHLGYRTPRNIQEAKELINECTTT